MNKTKKIILLILILVVQLVVGSVTKASAGAGAPGTLIAHYRFNEDAADDNDELVTNGAAPTNLTGWTQSPGTQWSIVGNKFQGAGDSANNYLQQDFGVVVSKKYKFSYDVTANSLVGGTSANQIGLSGVGTFGVTVLSSSVGTHTYYLLSIQSTGSNEDLRILLASRVTGGTIDLDNISIQLLAVEDNSRNDHDGLAQQDTDQIHRTGKTNGAFDFTPNDYILIPDHDDFSPILTPFSISAWIKMDDATNFVIASKYDTAGTKREWLFYTQGSDLLVFFINDEDNDKTVTRAYNSALTGFQGSWIHVIGTYNGGILDTSLKLYLNGVRVDDLSAGTDNFVSCRNTTTVVKIGNSDALYANGLIDNIAFLSRELDQFDIDFLYDMGSGTERWGERYGTMKTEKAVRTGKI